MLHQINNMVLLLVFILFCVSVVKADIVYTCQFDTSFLLTVNLNTTIASSFSYTVVSNTIPWLENGSLSLVQNQTYLIPDNGLLINPNDNILQGTGMDIDLGSYTYYSIPWITINNDTFLTNFTCYTD